MMTNAKRMMSVVVSILLLVAAAVVMPASAQEEQASGSGLQISPTRTELTIAQGGKDKVTVNVKNVTSNDIIVRGFINDFEVIDNSGDPQLIVEENAPQTSSSIKGFVEAISEFQLLKGESQDVVIPITIPSDAAPGAYFGAVRFAAVPTNTSVEPGQVALTASLASLVLIEVPGNITEQIQLLGTTAAVLSKDEEGREVVNRNSFFTSGPNGIIVDIKNTGNGFSKPFGKVTISRWGKEVYTYELNDAVVKENVFPGQTRDFTQEIPEEYLGKMKSFGRYTITVDAAYDNGSETISISGSFWVLPVWMIGVFVLIVALLGVGAAWLYRRRK